VGKSDVVTIGVDDLTQRCIGRIDAIDLPLVGRPVSQGQVLATLRRGSRWLASVAPITGVVVEINEKVVNRPSLINESPYDRGWVVKISPTSLRVELRNLLRGMVAERWMEAVRAELVQWFSPRMGTVLQDGGGMIDNISDLVSDREWEQLVNEFFPLVMSSRINLNP
jgi:glycine cleavage system H protein